VLASRGRNVVSPASSYTTNSTTRSTAIIITAATIRIRRRRARASRLASSRCTRILFAASLKLWAANLRLTISSVSLVISLSVAMVVALLSAGPEAPLPLLGQNIRYRILPGAAAQDQGCPAPPPEAQVEGGNDKEVEQRRDDQATQDDKGHRVLNLLSGDIAGDCQGN